MDLLKNIFIKKSVGEINKIVDINVSNVSVKWNEIKDNTMIEYLEKQGLTDKVFESMCEKEQLEYISNAYKYSMGKEIEKEINGSLENNTDKDIIKYLIPENIGDITNTNKLSMKILNITELKKILKKIDNFDRFEKSYKIFLNKLKEEKDYLNTQKRKAKANFKYNKKNNNTFKTIIYKDESETNILAAHYKSLILYTFNKNLEMMKQINSLNTNSIDKIHIEFRKMGYNKNNF